MDLPFDPVIPLLGIYPNESKTLFQKNIRIPMFIAVLLIIPKIWEQPKCPSVDEWSKKCGTQRNTTQQKKEGTSVLPKSMDVTGEHYTW